MADQEKTPGYFTRFPTAATLDPWLPTAARNVLLGICIFVNELGEAWPSVPVIATAAGCSVRTVQRMLPIIERHGYITIRKTKRGKGWSVNYYQVHYPAVRTLQVTRPKMTLYTAASGDTQDDTTCPAKLRRTIDEMNEGGAIHGDTSVVTESIQLVTPKMAHEQPILEHPKQQPTPREVQRQDGNPKSAIERKPTTDPYEGMSAEDRQWSLWMQEERQTFATTNDATRWQAFCQQLSRALEGKDWQWPPTPADVIEPMLREQQA